VAHLGDFAAAKREFDPTAERDTFTFCGEEFEVESALPGILTFELGAAVTGKMAEESAVGAMYEALYVSLGDEGYRRFRALAVENRVEIDDLLRVVFSALGQVTGRPTVQPADSSAGLQNTSPSSSTSASTSPDSQDRSVPHLVPVAEILAG
jgi:hypothetical protein